MITVTLSNTQNSSFLTVEPLEDFTIPLSGLSDTLQHQQLSLTFKLAYDADVFDYIMAYEELNAVVYDNSTPVFTGRIKNEITWTDNGYPLPVDSISLVISDNTYLFETKTQTEFALINQKLADIVESVCQSCGAELAENTTLRDVTVQAFVLDTDKSCLEALNNLLFQYGYAFGFNGSGQVKIIDLATVPAQRVQLTETDFFAGLEIKRTQKNYTGIQLKYNELVKKENEQVYWEGNGVNEENKVTPIVLRPHQYYPYDSDPTQEQREGQVYQTFENGYAESYTLYSGEQRYRRSTKTTLVYTENHRVVNDWDDGIVINRTEFGARQASVRLYNSANQDKNLYQLAIRADAWYRSQDVIYNYGENKTPYEYQSEYIYESEAAENFCSLLSRFFMGGNFKVTAQLSVGLEMGLHVAIDTGVGGFVCNAIVTSCEYDAKNQKYKCSFISYGEAAVIASRYKKYASNYGSFSESQVYTESELVKYRGLLTQLPENPKNGEFFLVKENFSVASRLRLVDNSLLKLINGNYLVIQKPFSASYIYIYQDNAWQRIDDKNDYHYILASNDLIAMGWKLSDNLQETLDQIDENAQQYADTAENNATSAAQNYADTAEQNAKDYTDGEIETQSQAFTQITDSLSDSITTVTNKVADIASDAKLTPDEKLNLLKDWNNILTESTVLKAEAQSILVSVTDYDAKLTALGTYLNGGLSWTSGTPMWLQAEWLPATEDIVGAEMRTAFADYNTAKTNLVNSISDRYAELAQASAEEAAQGYANTAEEKAKEAAQNYADTAEQNANNYTAGEIQIIGATVDQNSQDILGLRTDVNQKIEYVPTYLGVYEEAPDAQIKDWYLNSTDGILYIREDSEETPWNPITDYDNTQYTDLISRAMPDLLALAKKTGEVKFTNNLFAYMINVYKVFAKEINIIENGCIKAGSRYKADGSIDPDHATETGAYMGANGKLLSNKGVFDNVTISGKLVVGTNTFIRSCSQMIALLDGKNLEYGERIAYTGTLVIMDEVLNSDGTVNGVEFHSSYFISLGNGSYRFLGQGFYLQNCVVDDAIVHKDRLMRIGYTIGKRSYSGRCSVDVQKSNYKFFCEMVQDLNYPAYVTNSDLAFSTWFNI